MKPVKEKTKMKKLLIIFAVLCLAAPAMAADWNFFGSARMATFWQDNDFGPSGATADDQDILWDLQGNARIGANVKFNDQIGGGFEYGSGPNLRKLFGTYTFGNGSELLLGQTYTPSSSYFYSNSVYGDDGDLLGMGQFYVGRVPMIQWKMGGFKVALIKPTTGATEVKGDADDATYGVYLDGGGILFAKGTKDEVEEGIDDAVDDGLLTEEEASTLFTAVPASDAFEAKDVDQELPKIELAYKFKSDMFFIDVFGGYQTYDLEVAGKKSYSIDSYVIGGGGGVNFGAFYLNAGVHFGENLQNYGAASWLTAKNFSAANTETVEDAKIGAAGYDSTGDKIIDNEGLGYLAVLGFNASEMFTIEAGYGHQEYELDVANSKKDKADQFYLNCVINIAPGFFIVPEVGMVEWEVQDTDLNDFTYFGAKWQINF
jgi:hypothetical protein